MNLLMDRWFQVACRTGEPQRLAPAEIVSNEVDAVDLVAPRPDFRGALYQFLIGLLQTAYSPEDLDQWVERWETPPSVEELQAAFAPFRDAFELDSSGPAFMQDFDQLLVKKQGVGTAEHGRKKSSQKAEEGTIDSQPIESLLFGAASENAIKKNTDLFMHRGCVSGMCRSCAATALFTLQVNAPAGGPGYRVSVRGGGPLTTLRVPLDPNAGLWHKLWANVIPVKELNHFDGAEPKEILPWMAPTRVSDKDGFGITTPTKKCAHPLQAYWSMSWRVRLDFSNLSSGTCDVCGSGSELLLKHYRKRSLGVDYDHWIHPLTPYERQKDGNPPRSLKGAEGTSGYKHWLALTVGTSSMMSAAVVSTFGKAQWRLPEGAANARLWAFGLDMDQAKALCWYDATVPLYAVAPEKIDDFREVVQHLLDVADEAARALNRSVKEASSNRPAERASDPAVAQSFWQASKNEFYEMLRKAADADLDNDALLAALYERWLKRVRGLCLDLFDQWVVAVPIEDMRMGRVVRARYGLEKSLNKGAAKELWKIIRAQEKAA